MSRKDSKGRRLRDGEGQRKNGCYMYRYTDLLGARQVVYSWKLLPTDPLPKGKKEDVSLREKESEIELMLKGEDSVQAKTLTVNDVFDIYLRKKKHYGSVQADSSASFGLESSGTYRMGSTNALKKPRRVLLQREERLQKPRRSIISRSGIRISGIRFWEKRRLQKCERFM